MTDRARAAASLLISLAAALFAGGCGEDRQGSSAPDPNAYLKQIADRIESGGSGSSDAQLAVADLRGLLGRLQIDAEQDPTAAASPLEAGPLTRILDLLGDADPEWINPDVFLQCALSRHAVAPDTLTRLDAAVQRSSDQRAYLALYGSAHVALISRDKSALERFQRAVVARPDRPEARFYLGQTLILAGRLDDALREIDASLAKGYDQPRGEYHRAVLLTRLGRDEDALRAFRELGLNEGSLAARAWNQAGKILLDRGDLDGAEDSFRAGVARDAMNPAVCYNLGKILYDKGGFADAQSFLERASSLRGSDPKAPTLLGRIAEENGDDAEAERRYRSAIQNLPQDTRPDPDGEPPEPVRRLANLLRRTDRLGEIEALKAWFPPS